MPPWEGKTTSFQYHCLLQFEDTQEKVPVKTSSWLALHFFGLWIVFSPFILSLLLRCGFYLPVVQDGGYWISMEVLRGIVTGPVPACTYRRDVTGSKPFLFLASQFYFRHTLLLIIFVNVMRTVHGLTTNVMADNLHKQNLRSVSITIRFHLARCIPWVPKQSPVYPIKEAFNPHANVLIPPARVNRIMWFNFFKICEYYEGNVD